MSCKNKTPELPVLSFNYIDGKKELYKIDNFIFTNQDGETVTSSSTEGKVHTINFFFTSCPSICPPMRIDTVDKLKKHAELHNINSTQWNLLRAPSEEKLEDIASVLKTNFKPNENGTDFYHSSYVALIDKEQYIRGFYNILLDEEVTLLKRDVESLLD